VSGSSATHFYVCLPRDTKTVKRIVREVVVDAECRDVDVEQFQYKKDALAVFSVLRFLSRLGCVMMMPIRGVSYKSGLKTRPLGKPQ
jgi:hypothetical protein